MSIVLEAGHDTREPNNVSTQTEEEEKAETGNIKIPLEMIKVIEDALKEEEKSKKVFDKLAPFHIREAARLQLSRTVPVTAVSQLTVTVLLFSSLLMLYQSKRWLLVRMGGSLYF